MEQLGPSLLELGMKVHDELIHTASLIVTTAIGARLSAGEQLSSMSSAVRGCEGINLTPEPTEPAVELIHGVLPLLKTVEGLVQCVELCLTRATVSTLQIRPHLTCSRKIGNLRADLESDGLTDDHLGRGVVGSHFSSFFSKASKTAGERGEDPSEASKAELEASER